MVERLQITYHRFHSNATKKQLLLILAYCFISFLRFESHKSSDYITLHKPAKRSLFSHLHHEAIAYTIKI